MTFIFMVIFGKFDSFALFLILAPYAVIPYAKNQQNYCNENGDI